MTARRKLEWYGDEDGRLGFPDCMVCVEKMDEPGLVHAAASVGIEYGESTGLMLREYLDAFHAGGHKQ